MYGAKVCVMDKVMLVGDSVDSNGIVITQNQQVIHRVTHTCA